MQVHLLGRALARAAAPTVFAASVLCGLSSLARAQIHFSIDYHGLTIGVPNTFSAVPITEGDILVPATPLFLPALGPLPPPGILISGGVGGLGLPLHPGCIGHPPAIPCGVEVDALSYGMDYAVPPGFLPGGTYVFSVDECSSGIPGSPLPPNVLSESPVFDSAADIFEDLGLPPGPLPPVVVPSGNTGIVDGDGLVSGSGFVYPNVGIVEPTFPGLGPTGDDIDAIDIDAPFIPVLGTFFSLDAAFINPCLGLPNTGSSFANGFLPGAVLVTMAPGGPPAVYAPPFVLGLDLVFGPGYDDLDALALAENGIPGYQPSLVPYDWVPAGGSDMLLFSVRRGSSVVGMPDSFFGIPIEPGDILSTPLPGGFSPFPSIFIAAEWLGLSTARSGFFPVADLDALDTLLPPTFSRFCFPGIGGIIACPCGQPPNPVGGCANFGAGATTGAVLDASGVPSLAADTMVLITSNHRPTVSGIWNVFFTGSGTPSTTGIPHGAGVRCVSTALKRLYSGPAAGGSLSKPGLGDLSVSARSAALGVPISAGQTRHYFNLYRDASAVGPCGSTASTVNTTNAGSTTWLP